MTIVLCVDATIRMLGYLFTWNKLTFPYYHMPSLLDRIACNTDLFGSCVVCECNTNILLYIVIVYP